MRSLVKRAGTICTGPFILFLLQLLSTFDWTLWVDAKTASALGLGVAIAGFQARSLISPADFEDAK